MSTDHIVVNERLSAGLNARHPVAHGVETRFGRVDLDDLFQLGFASLQLVCPMQALLLALLQY